MQSMTTKKHESLNFYNYLCQKIGSEEVVKVRRLALVINDIGQKTNRITSGSKGEGLDLKGSDIDVMTIDCNIEVIESEKDFNIKHQRLSFVINTEDTQPCFTQLYLVTHHHNLILNFVDPLGLLNLLEMKHLRYVLSSEQYKQWCISHHFSSNLPFKLHGPCISSKDGQYDFASCLKCETWICQAKPWISRPRTAWPSPELISKITSCGVLFVPIGCKGSINENIEWRISFSVAEKILIFSFSHTQLLCYAMLKILLKELVDRNEDLKGLLCSYYIKTLMFWISEETDPYLWRPDNIIPCFMACLKRLLYCVRYSILSHYFIPENNFFLLRFNTNNKEKLITILTSCYRQGIDCFAFSETLQDYRIQSNGSTESLVSRNSRLLQQMIPTFCTVRLMLRADRVLGLLFTFLHSSRTGLSRVLFALLISEASLAVADTHLYPNVLGNKHYYFKYMHCLSHLTIGLDIDALSGLLKLASFLYVHKNYEVSLTIIKYILQKCTDKKIYRSFIYQDKYFNPIQKHVPNLMKKENLKTIMKSLIIHSFKFERDSFIIPQELQLDVSGRSNYFHSLPFTHFLNFLCYYHLHDISSYAQSLQQLEHVQHRLLSCILDVPYPEALNTVICCGIARQLIGDPFIARQYFEVAAGLDEYNRTSAASRLFNLI
ncbi:Hypothetical predicted protein [Mytilus galloprovincialis]|uniref:Mab-21-like HhH/H2TH-like domain-containing protein n=1 Tax=Mytilus galloprovincialis TaxID=29158 RepID=A0A8B6C269_MYTGA|nr:Hypothetical predicted protein [Mytilus galloprovincialis]